MRSQIRLLILFLALVTSIGSLLAFSGWNSRGLNGDMLPYIDDAQKFVLLGQIPATGTLTSFASYTPPGIAWLFVPGIYLSDDPRLFESPASIALYFGTLLGIFLLARRYLGIECACLAVVLWAWSKIGLTFAESSWARGHPFFFVWMVYWAGSWVERRNPIYLCFAFATWAIGMYMHLEIAPALFILPVVWFYYRPPLKPDLAVLGGVLLVAAVWYPYIRFEAHRDFVDLKSQVFRHRILPSNYEDAWCDPALLPEEWREEWRDKSTAVTDQNTTVSSPGLESTLRESLHSLASRGYLIATTLLVANFRDRLVFPAVSFTLLGLSIFAMAFMFVKGSGARIEEITTRRIGYTRFFKVLGIGLAGGGLLVNEITVAWFLSLDGSLDADLIMNLRKLQVLALVGGVSLLVSRKVLGVAAARVGGLPIAKEQAAASPKLLGISLLVPWIILLSMAEADRLQRFWWLSPLQFIILASTVTYIAGQLGFNAVWRWVGSVMLVVAILPSSLLSSRITAWADHGWSGTLPNRLKAVDSLAQIIKADNRTNAAIGYGLYYQRYMSVFNTMDNRYRVGADYDLFFRLRHGISNLSKCAEGFSPLDQYRIEEAHYIPPAGDQKDRIPMPAGASFRLLERIDTLSVLKRTDVD